MDERISEEVAAANIELQLLREILKVEKPFCPEFL